MSVEELETATACCISQIAITRRMAEDYQFRALAQNSREFFTVTAQRLLGASAAEFAQREAADDLTRRQEKLNLIRLLRDETNSSSVHARCVAIVGEGS